MSRVQKTFVKYLPFFAFLTFLNSFLSVSFMWLVGLQVDTVASLTTHSVLLYLINITLLMIGLEALSILVWTLLGFLHEKLFRRILYIREEMFLRQFVFLKIKEMDANINEKTLYSRYKYDLDNIAATTTSAFRNIIDNLTRIATYLPAIFALHFVVGFAVLFMLSLQTFPLFFIKFLQRKRLELQQTFEELSNVLLLGFEDFETWFFTKKHNILKSRINVLSKKYVTRNKKFSLMQGIINSTAPYFSELLMRGVSVLIFFFVITKYFENALTLGSATVVIGLYYTLQNGVRNIFNSYTSVRTLEGIYERVRLNLHPSLPSKKNHISKITADNLSFYYDNKKIFDSINIKFFVGKFYWVFGASGVGKTTLIQLLLGNLSYEGTLKLDNKHYTDIPESFLRQHFSYMSSENIVFDGSLRDNITYWSSKKDDTKFTECVLVAGLDKDFKDFDTNSQSCLEFSEGQKQKVCLARTLYENKPVVILDEPFANLDSHNIASIQKNLKDSFLLREKLVVIISHVPPSFSSFFDEVLVVENNHVSKH